MDSSADSRFDTYKRQLDIADPAKFTKPVVIVGVGALGSAAAIGVAKMGVANITLIDPDKVDAHNQANQLCCPEHVGLAKVDSVGSLVALTSLIKPVQISAKVVGRELVFGAGGKSPFFPQGIVISTPDCMTARKDVWASCRLNPRVAAVLDARATVHCLEIHIVNPMSTADIKRYEETLFSNEQATPEPCGARGISYTSLFAGAHLSNLVKRLQLGETCPEFIRHGTGSSDISVQLSGKIASNAQSLAEIEAGFV